MNMIICIIYIGCGLWLGILNLIYKWFSLIREFEYEIGVVSIYDREVNFLCCYLKFVCLI